MRVDSAEAIPPTRSRKRRPAAGEAKGRKINLTDDVHDRLALVAMGRSRGKRRVTISDVAGELLDRHLPRFKVEREG
jgi:hypothetical protein